MALAKLEQDIEAKIEAADKAEDRMYGVRRGLGVLGFRGWGV